MNNLNDIKYNLEKMEFDNDGACYKVEMKVPLSYGWIDNVTFYAKKDDQIEDYTLSHKYNDNEYAYFETKLYLPTYAIYHYYFTLDINKQTNYLKKEYVQNSPYLSNKEMWKLSVNFDAPYKAKGAIMYHSFIDRDGIETPINPKEIKGRTMYPSYETPMIIGPNKDGVWNHDYYGGNAKGLTKKLDILEELNVQYHYLSPILYSQANHGYDTIDYKKIDPYFGTEKDVIKYVKEANKRGIRIMSDNVFNHVGNDSIYYNQFHHHDTIGAYHSKYSEYYEMLRKRNPKEEEDYYEKVKHLPKITKINKYWQDYIYSNNGLLDIWFDYTEKNHPNHQIHVTEEELNTYYNFIINELKIDKDKIYIDKFNKRIYITKDNNNKYICQITNELISLIYHNWNDNLNLSQYVKRQDKVLETIMSHILVQSIYDYYKNNNRYNIHILFNQLQNENQEDSLLKLIEFIYSQNITKTVKEVLKEDFDERKDYYYHNFVTYNDKIFTKWWDFDNCIETNCDSKRFQDLIYGEGGAIDYLHSLGIDDKRYDVADGLTDEFIYKSVSKTKELDPEALTELEVWKDPTKMGRGYITSGRGGHGTINYPLLDALLKYFINGDTDTLNTVMDRMIYDYPDATMHTSMLPTSTHDTSRLINMCAPHDEFRKDGEWFWSLKKEDYRYLQDYKLTPEQIREAIETEKVFLTTLYFCPGLITIFYGDELGVEGLGNLKNRSPYPQIWTPERKMLYKHYVQLGQTKTSNEFLKIADWKQAELNKNYFQYKRKNGNEEILLTANRTKYPVKIHIPDEYYESECLLSFNEYNSYDELSPKSAMILKKVRK